jgi:glycine hydroxymethyltransferase
MSLPHGGHLTHGWNVSITGKYFRSVQYEVRKDTGRIDYDQVRDIAKRERPKLIWAGGTAVPRIIDFDAFAEVAREVDAIFAADVAHIAGLIVGGAHPSPVKVADVVTTTTHKTLRGPRGAMFVSKSEHASVLDRAAQPEFSTYAHSIVTNAKALADDLIGRDFELVSGGTDNHLLLIDLTNKNVTGKVAAKALDRAGIELNYNTVPFDPRKPFDPSGIRLGTPSVTSRGMGVSEMVRIAEWIDQIVTSPNDEELGARTKAEIAELCRAFPAPGISVTD